MLEFEEIAATPDGSAKVNVFVDKDKGHVVYISHTGTMVVVDNNKTKDGRTRAAGFAMAADGCSSCDGC